MKKSPLLILALLSGCILKPVEQKGTLQELQKGELPDVPTVITLKMKKYRPESGRQLKEVFVSNFSTNVRRGKAEESYARDGLSDEFKARAVEYNMNSSSPNSANPMFSDLMLFLSGIKHNQQSFLNCPNSLNASRTNDVIKYMDDRVNPPQLTLIGLRDCEKAYIGLRQDSFDFDKDTIPDYLELRCGLNPRNPNDAALSPTGDGVTQLEKCKRHIPLDESANSESNKLYAYQYNIRIEKDQTRTITISNVPVLKENKQNLIAFYIIEMDNTTAKTYLYTAHSLLTPNPDRSGEYEFNYWVTPGDTNTYFNQVVSFQ